MKYIILNHRVNESEDINFKDMPDEVEIIPHKIFDTLEEANDYLLDIEKIKYKDYDTKFLRNQYLFIYKYYWYKHNDIGHKIKYTYKEYYRIIDIDI